MEYENFLIALGMVLAALESEGIRECLVDSLLQKRIQRCYVERTLGRLGECLTGSAELPEEGEE